MMIFSGCCTGSVNMCMDEVLAEVCLTHLAKEFMPRVSPRCCFHSRLESVIRNAQQIQVIVAIGTAIYQRHNVIYIVCFCQGFATQCTAEILCMCQSPPQVKADLFA